MNIKFKNSKCRIAAIMLVFVAVLSSVSFFMQLRMKQILYRYMENQAANQAGEMAELLKRRFDMEIQNMERIAYDIELINDKKGDITNTFSKHMFSDKSEYITSGILLLNGDVVYGDELEFSEFSGIQNAFRGNSSVSFCEGKGLLFTVPIYNGKNVKYVLYRLYSVYVLMEEFFVECFEGKGDTALIDLNEKQIIPFSEHSFDDMGSEAYDSYIKLQDMLNVAPSASVYYKEGSTGQFMFIGEVSNYGVYLVGIVPYEVMSKGLSSLITLVLWVFALLVILMLIGIAYLFNAEARAKESDDLRMAKLIAENASKSKSYFLANMSHEIRTPINAIMGMNEMILRDCDNAEIKKYAFNIQSASQSLLSIINDILDLSKIESGKMEIFPNDYQLDALIHDVVNMMQIKADQKGLEFNVEAEESLPNKICGDEARIRQIMVNILNNAVKYTNEGSILLKISARGSQGEDIILEIRVSDTGIGIRQEDIGKLFGSFERLDMEKNHNIEGSGLGLAITKKFVELMGGSIEAESEYGKGSQFIVYIPQKIVDSTPIGKFEKNTDSNAEQQDEYKESFTAPEARILVVDDNEINLMVVENLLKRTKVRVTLCSSGKDCLDIMKKEIFHIILLDHIMPEMDGIEVMKRIKTLEGNKCDSAKIIALTANAIKGVREMYINEGFDDYLSKPIESSKLEEMIKKCLPRELVREEP